MVLEDLQDIVLRRKARWYKKEMRKKKKEGNENIQLRLHKDTDTLVKRQWFALGVVHSKGFDKSIMPYGGWKNRRILAQVKGIESMLMMNTE